MKQRIITAIILLAIFLPITYIGGVPFLLLVYLMASIGLYELLKMRKMPILTPYGILSFIFMWILLLPDSLFNSIQLIHLTKVEIGIIGVLVLLALTVISKNKFTYEDAGFLLLSILYITIGFYYMVQTRDAGLSFLFYALSVVWITDSGAYFVGMKFGKRKLWPEISPNKTIAGFVGGIVSALFVAVLFSNFSSIDIAMIPLMIVTMILSVFGQLGDLAESALKRHYGVKDSGHLFPGHGGILDRCDSLLFVMPLLNFLLIL